MWRTKAGVFSYRNFGRFAESVLAGNGKPITGNELAGMATRYSEWVCENYFMPSDAYLQQKPSPTPWNKNDKDPHWQPLIKVGKDLAFWKTIAARMRLLITIAAMPQLAAAILYGAGPGAAIMAGTNLTKGLALMGLSTHSAFQPKVNPGASTPSQIRYLKYMICRTDILHRYFSSNESDVSYDGRMAVRDIMRAGL